MQVMALGRHASALLDFKTLSLERQAHMAGHAPGGKLRAPAAMAGNVLHGIFIPHLGVELGREAIQIHAVRRHLLLAQHGPGIAYIERQQHLAVIKGKAMHARQQSPPLLGQLFAKRAQYLIGRQKREQILARDRVGLHRDKMQNARASGIGLPCRPGDQEIQAEAKAGFQNAPLRCIGPGCWQVAATEKNLAGLVEAAELAVIAIAESGAVGGAIRHPCDRFRHGK